MFIRNSSAMSAPLDLVPAPSLDRKLHIKYWTRCLTQLLPTAYQSNDSSRLFLAFFNLSALDLLSAFPHSQTAELRAWILKCQHPNGGFCGSPNHKYPDSYYRSDSEKKIEPASLPATFFGLLCLALVGGLDGVDRVGTLNWLKTVQRADGSFGELVESNGNVAGGRDMRYCHFASGIRRMLRGDPLEKNENAIGRHVSDIDVDGLVQHIKNGETYDGGIAETGDHEAHAGYTYCGIASLVFLGRLPVVRGGVTMSKDSLSDISATIRWLVSRQQPYDPSTFEDSANAKPDDRLQTVDDEYLDNSDERDIVGCNGRCNKTVDTCYCYWVGASLSILGHGDLLDKQGCRRFMIEKTQHRIGGFSKTPGDHPDMYHAYLGLAALSIMGEPGLKPVDPLFCISNEAVAKLAQSITVAKLAESVTTL